MLAGRPPYAGERALARARPRPDRAAAGPLPRSARAAARAGRDLRAGDGARPRAALSHGGRDGGRISRRFSQRPTPKRRSDWSASPSAVAARERSRCARRASLVLGLFTSSCEGVAAAQPACARASSSATMSLSSSASSTHPGERPSPALSSGRRVAGLRERRGRALRHLPRRPRRNGRPVNLDAPTCRRSTRRPRRSLPTGARSRSSRSHEATSDTAHFRHGRRPAESRDAASHRPTSGLVVVPRRTGRRSSLDAPLDPPGSSGPSPKLCARRGLASGHVPPALTGMYGAADLHVSRRDRRFVVPGRRPHGLLDDPARRRGRDPR